MQRAAQFVSLFFHPLLFPTYATALLVVSNPHYYAHLSSKHQLLWIIIVFVLTFVFPAIWLLMMKGLKLISSLQLTERKERIVPYIATATFYLWTYRMFKPSPGNVQFSDALVSKILLGASVAIFICFFINIFRKISLHSAGAGSLFAIVVLLSAIAEYDLRWILVGAILLAGLIGTARMLLKAHTLDEVLAGFFAGFTGQYVAFVVIPRFFS